MIGSEYGGGSFGAKVRLRLVGDARSASWPLIASGMCQDTM